MERLKWPAAAVGLAVLGAALRRWQLSAAFDGAGLADGLHPASVAVTAVLLAAAAVFLRMALLTRDKSPQPPEGLTRWDMIFGAGDDKVYLGGMAAAAFFTVAAIPDLVREGMALRALWQAADPDMQRWMDNGLVHMILAVFAAASSVGLLLSARAAFRMCGEGAENGWLMLPVLSNGAWIMQLYRSNPFNPTLWEYLPLVLAALCGMLFYLECGGLAFDKGAPRRMFWLAGMTVVLSGVSLASRPGWGSGTLLLGQTMAALAALWEGPANLAHPPRAAWLEERAKQLEERRERQEREARPEDFQASEDAVKQEDEDHV